MGWTGLVNPGVATVLTLTFVQVALPILIGFVTIGWWQNKRLDEMGRRLDDRFNEVGRRFDGIDRRLDRIEAKLENHGDRITRREERTSLVRS
jgi:tetrahydromethanopterin S-methyltransferase subunit G